MTAPSQKEIDEYWRRKEKLERLLSSCPRAVATYIIEVIGYAGTVVDECVEFEFKESYSSAYVSVLALNIQLMTLEDKIDAAKEDFNLVDDDDVPCPGLFDNGCPYSGVSANKRRLCDKCRTLPVNLID